MSYTIIIGDSTHNTLSVIRSLGAANEPFTLILKSDDDYCSVAKSKYLRFNHLYQISSIEECLKILQSEKRNIKPYIICTFDEAAEFIDRHENILSKDFITPCRGKQIGDLFNKDVQCRLARECGLTVPVSINFNRSEKLNKLPIDFPIILKPLYSTKGEKSDIHICRNTDEINNALSLESHCNDFILQEFIEKEYELDCIGVKTEHNVIIAGAVKKIRHYPHLIGAGAYGKFIPSADLEIDIDALNKFLTVSHYHGPFSVEFLKAGNKNYFMEVNFRNEGLAQVATNAGANLHALYVNPDYRIDIKDIRPIYMMNYSIDYLHVKEGRVSKSSWWRDFMRTRCFINFSPTDPMPMLAHYLKKLHLC